MHIAIELVSLVVVVLVVTASSERVGLPAPVVLVAVGAAAAYVPGVPEVRLEPEVVLVGLLPPLLYNTALGTSLVDFSANRRPILLLSVGLVAFTAAGVAVVAKLVVPGLEWWAAFAIGAVVAPPDAVAATAVARRIGLPRGIVTVLEGESLLNDATALVALNTAIGASLATVSLLDVGVDFLRTAVGGVVVGIAVFVLVGKVRRRLTEPVLDTSVSVVTPFTAYVAAEAIHASGVVAVVIAGLLLGHKAPVLQTASSRIAERLNWATFSFLLENAVFLLIGLQARWLLEEVSRSTLSGGQVALACVAVLAAVIVLRFCWVFPVRSLLLFRNLAADQRPPYAYTAIVSWAGMRGVVTLAAAFAIPPDTVHREVLLLIAFTVTAGTLALQGLSLPYLVRRLGVRGPDPREDALAYAELLQQASGAGMAELEHAQPATHDDPVLDLLRSRIEQRDFAAWERLGGGPGGIAATDVDVAETPSERYARIRLAMLAAERARVLQIRDRGQTPHTVVEQVLRTLDVEESILGQKLRRDRDVIAAGGSGAGRAQDQCDHLASAAVIDHPEATECEDCVREGSSWVHLRRCLRCGHVGCCDSSPRRHATAHFRGTEHPVVHSAEPHEDWRWCFVDEIVG